MAIHVPFVGRNKKAKGSYIITESGARLYQSRFSQEPELLVLSALSTMGSGTFHEIAANTHLSGSEVRSAIKNLQRKGFISEGN